ncbi:MAG: DsbA family protein [Polyangiaceae bacterium]
MKISSRAFLAAALVASLAHCSATPQSTAPPVTVVVAQPTPPAPTSAPPPAAAPVEAPAETDATVPIEAIDPTHGSRTALVTIVFFGDFQCPFTKRAVATIHDLEDKYGEDLRVVWKNDPLPFHPHAREAAEAAEAVQMLGGSDAFWKFHEAVFANQSQLDPSSFDGWAQAAGVNVDSFHQLVLAHAGGAKVDADLALAKRLYVSGTPGFFVNGVGIQGAQAIDKFVAVIDAELEKAKSRIAAGTSPDRVYVAMTAENYKSRPPPPPDTARVADDTATVWKVPLGGAPVRGSNTALVTIVEFADFQCPFCKRVEPTLEKIRSTYGDKVRFAWRDQPLPFHQRALATANLARDARAEKGLAGFWAVHDALFASQPKLEDSDLETIATAAGLNLTKARDAMASDKYKSAIEEDSTLAQSVQANGTPTFFLNGRRLVGAQPFEKFQSIIDEEITHAQALLAKGTTRAALYETLVKNGQSAPPEAHKAKPTVAPPGVPAPSGPLGAGLVVTDLVVGTGPAAKNGDHISVHYVGTLTDGTEFDSSRKRGRPFSFNLGTGQVIKGWDQGLVGMRVGGRRKLMIPASLAYADRAMGSIPANSDLVFDVELLSIP